jgi:trans-aconitate methyltransferase
METPNATGWDTKLYDDKHSFVWKHGAALLNVLAPRPGERILDLGCGTGHLTARIAAAGADVIGIDSSPAMVEEASRLYPNIHFQVADGRQFAFPEAFDAVFSNAVLHWIREPEKTAACIRQALRPGGCFVAEFGGRGNVRAIVAALQSTALEVGGSVWEHPWYYPGIGEYTALLERAGLEVTDASLFDRPTPLEGQQGIRHWIEMFAGDLPDQIPPAKRESFFQHVDDLLRPVLYRQGTWFADYRRLRIRAHRIDDPGP